jgi:hypothetical protein
MTYTNYIQFIFLLANSQIDEYNRQGWALIICWDE